MQGASHLNEGYILEYPWPETFSRINDTQGPKVKTHPPCNR